MTDTRIILSPFQYKSGSSSDVVTCLEGVKGGYEDGAY